MERKNLFGVRIKKNKINDILEKIKKNIGRTKGFFHIVSINPEIVVITQEDELFKKVVDKAQIKIIDGKGIVAAGKILGVDVGDPLTGVDLMLDLLKTAERRSLRVMLIGGRANLAKSLADCYSKKFSKARFVGLQGIKNISHPKKKEERMIFSIVSAFKPHLVFTAFGSPYQELWLWRNRRHFQGCVCMGVGGAFDFLSGKVPRAPRFVQKMGLEWLFRLIIQPWRWKRQLRLIKFGFLVLREKIELDSR